MRAAIVALLAAAAFSGCQQKTEQRPATTTPPSQAQPPAQAADKRTPRPSMKQSDARIWIDSLTVAKGASGAFKINYYGVEPLRAIVLPLTFPVGMHVDSVSFAGGILEYLSSRPTRIENDQRFLLMTGIPMTEPDIPAKEGILARVHFTLGQDAVSGKIDETFVPPGNYLTYVDTAGALVEPIFEPGTLTVQ
ncbi:MAG: hypothetical protein AB1792_03835 [Candidatus Zixiibacteriota bacterium]